MRWPCPPTSTAARDVRPGGSGVPGGGRDGVLLQYWVSGRANGQNLPVRSGVQRETEGVQVSTDDEGFRAFVLSSGDRLLQVALLLCGNRQTAEDLLQTAYSRLYPRWDRIEDPYAFTRRVLVNLRNDRWRRLRRERLGDVPDQPQPDSTDSSERRVVVLSALALLTARERGVLVLRYYEDLSEAEIAATLDIAPGTVKSTAARALGKLREGGRLDDLARTPLGDHRG